jgi:microcystin-dependent protein
VAQPYVGEIRMFGGSFAPVGWMFCDGQQLPISENETLFQLIGTTYGGDGEETFNLPNLQSRVPIHQGVGPSGTTYVLAEAAGVEEVTLTTQQIPAHTHPLLGTSDNANTTIPTNAVPATVPIFGVRPYGTDAPKFNLIASSVGSSGGSQPHTNIQPYLTVTFIISLFGIFPSPT